MTAILTPAHWLFLFWVVVIIIVMGWRKDPIIPCLLGLFSIGWVVKGTVVGAVSTIFISFIVAGNEFWSIIVVIGLIVALSKLLTATGADYIVMSPAAKIMVNPDIAFWVLGFTMLLASWFFWPSPATALIGAIMFPVAVRAGLPVMGAAMAMNLFGHGIGLSTDYIIQGAPTITAKAAGFSNPSEVISASIPLSLVMGVVTTVVAYIIIKRDIRNSNGTQAADNIAIVKKPALDSVSYIMAVLTPAAFLADVVAMLTLGLRGGDATALLGATAVLLLAVGCLLKFGPEGLERITDYIKDGFMFGIKIFAPVIVIAGFFFMGKGELAKVILGEGATGFLEDFGVAISASIPLNKLFVALVSLFTGIIVGLDGSGFSPLPLVGALAGTFGKAIEADKAVLAALGQIAGVWTGGGTIIPWGLVPVAAIAGVNPLDLARKNFIPVCCGFAAVTIAAVMLM